MAEYHYTECGLDNVYIEGAVLCEDHAGEASVTIPAIGQLHKMIATEIVARSAKMAGQELRFLRSEMGLTQAQLAKFLKVTLLTISRWERNESPIKDTAEMLVRLMAAKRLDLDVGLDVESVSELVTESALTREIRINGNEKGQYSLLDAA